MVGVNLTKRRDIAAFVSFIFASDFMHFVQTRLTTIDVFITFFVILMYYFMHKYCTLSFYDTALKKTFLPLGACGIAFGFGIASKWTGFYAGAGLAVIFFLTLWKRYREFCYAKKNPKGNTEGISHKEIVKNFKPYALKTIGFCVIFFVVIPFMIYLLSYIPFKDYSEGGLLTRMLDNQASMFDYHSKLEATHPYSSVWYEWPTMERPIFYYSKEMGEDLRRGISAFGNPLVWWSGIFAFFFMLYLATKKRDKNARFLCIGYLAQYLPWILITRCTFIYHYFPSVPFIALMIGYCFLQLQKKVSKKVFLTLLILFAVICFGLFLLFYPVLSGEVVSREFVINYLKWFENTWTLVV
ncbi:MAG: phospholipid carrier-dependent glycosyltransferase [Lachnospiraceae bacterium]|nr:phospholipid carrier-dependent glycosyltransferase [Lachnospiraceae bacterium]